MLKGFLNMNFRLKCHFVEEMEVAIKVVYFETALEQVWFRWIVLEILVHLTSFSTLLDGLIYLPETRYWRPHPAQTWHGCHAGFAACFFLSALSVFGVNFFHLSYLLKPASCWHQHMFATGGIALHLVWRMWIPQVLRIRKTFFEKYMFYNTRLRYFEFKINTKIKLIEQKINF